MFPAVHQPAQRKNSGLKAATSQFSIGSFTDVCFASNQPNFFLFLLLIPAGRF